ncbi:hypothetical protein BC739_008033 [Kutzneria viridogrisea]|uniref:Secreted protein n=2 Tax=Kutzneria TaxID=43356 RepID=W5W9T3_9PSEU|nr:HNH endonuclease family protein [Kutzneria albida]AHH97296.1 secreted protein [Kutzneria albida DSM 43870]MBA8930786.1 hypothetical protein [Kutzneria viridogrisea]
MVTTRFARAITAAAVALATAFTVTTTPAHADPAAATTPVTTRQLPPPPPAATARTELAELVIEPPHSMAGYSRSRFPHWSSQGGRCDTREVVLARDGQDVRTDAECRAVSGTWWSPYDGKTLTSASQLDIDHMVPLAAAWRSGADTWTTDRRKAFANDLVHSQLIAVSASSNRAKGDQTPDSWRPSNTAYWCEYSRAWTDVKHVYGLSITEPEYAALDLMLGFC